MFDAGAEEQVGYRGAERSSGAVIIADYPELSADLAMLV